MGEEAIIKATEFFEMQVEISFLSKLAFHLLVEAGKRRYERHGVSSDNGKAMQDKTPKPSRVSPVQEKNRKPDAKKRLSSALRENLKRRKAAPRPAKPENN